MKIDKEFQELLPVLSMDEYEKLEQNILKYGMLDPIKVWQDTETKEWIIIDGHNRYSILQKHKDKIDRLYDAWIGFKIIYEKELHNRDEVKQWMLEQQLGRRNLSDAERYDIVQRFKSVLEKKAKENQSFGGKGLSNLTKVNTRKEMAKATGVSEGTYRKLDKVMKSENKEIKQQLREKKISVDKAYQKIINSANEQKEKTTPQQQITKVDDRMNEIDKEIFSLKTEREELVRRRRSLFEALDIICDLKYEFIEVGDGFFSFRNCRFYIETERNKEIFVECSVHYDENPDDVWLRKIPAKYKNDFIMLWKKAHREDVEYFNKRTKEFEEAYKEAVSNDTNKHKDFYKQCYRTLAKSIHPDNSDGNVEAMQCLNQLKVMWGI